jgi:hypothetical protein
MATRSACGTAASWALTRSAGQTSSARAYDREATAQRLPDRGVPLRRVMEDVGEQRLKEELPCGETLDEAHGAATAGTRPR